MDAHIAELGNCSSSRRTSCNALPLWTMEKTVQRELDTYQSSASNPNSDMSVTIDCGREGVEGTPPSSWCSHEVPNTVSE